MAIEGKIEAIISPSSTQEKEVITLPLTTANSVYFPDGEDLLLKYAKGELGNSSGGSSSSVDTSSFVPNKWYGKHLVTLGDSITASGYPNYIKEILGCRITNKGSSGGSYGRDFDEIIPTVDWTYVDVVTYMTGQNAAGGGTMKLAESGLMDITDWNDYSSYPDNFFGGVAKVINYIRAQNPNIKIYLLGQANSGVLPLANNTPYLIRDHMQELSMFLSIPFIDTFSHCGINFVNWANYSTDGVHINDEGKKLVGRNAAYEMMYL